MPTEFQPPPVSDLIAILPQLIVALVALVVQITQKGAPVALLQNMVIADQFANFFNIVFIVGTLISVLMSVDYLEREKISHGEYYALLLLTTVGMMIMGAATDLIVVFIGLEVLSISLYILAGYARERLVSEEAALKYF